MKEFENEETIKSNLESSFNVSSANNTDSLTSSLGSGNSTCHSSEISPKHPPLGEPIKIKGGFYFDRTNIYRPCVSCGDTTGLCASNYPFKNPKDIICLSENSKIDELVKKGKYRLTTLQYKEFELPWLIKIEKLSKELQEYDDELDIQLDDESEEEEKPWDDHLAVPEEEKPELPDNSKEQEFIFNWYKVPIRDKVAALKQLRALGHKPGDKFYCKKDNKIPYECRIGEFFFNSEGEEQDWGTATDWCITAIEKKALKDENGEKILNENGNTIWIKNLTHNDFLSHAIETSNNGVEWFIIPAFQDNDGGGIQAVNSSCTYVCFTERDGSPDKSYEENVEEQKQDIELISKRLGIIPKLVNSSGGKSLHNFIKLKEAFEFLTEEDRETYRQVMRMLCIAYRSDPKIVENSNREMRYAGTFRKSKGNYQEVLLETDFEYSIEELFKKLKPHFPQGMSKERFRKCCNFLEKLEDIKKKNPELLTEKIKELNKEYLNILNCSEDKLNEPKNRKSQKWIIDTSKPLNNTTEVPLIEMVAAWCKKLIEEGVTEGGRNTEGFKIAAHLISIKANSEKLGIKTTDDEEDIFFTYANNCHPPIPDAEASSIWNSAQQRVNPDEASLKKEFYFNKAGKWLRIHNPEEWDRIKPKTEYQKSKEEWIAEYEIQRKEQAKFKLTRTPDIYIEDGYFPKLKLEDLPDGIIGFIGGQGTGKTEATTYLTDQYLKGKIIQIGHLNSLLKNVADRSGLVHHQDAKRNTLLSRDRLAITDISTAFMLNLMDYEANQFLLKIDEVEQVFESLANNHNLKGKARLEYRKKLEWLIRNAKYVMIADADLSDATLNWLEKVRNDGKKAFIIKNGKRIGNGRTKIRISTDKGGTLKRLYEAEQQGYKIIIPCETKSDLLAIEKNLGNNNDFLAIHGDNSGEPEIQKLIDKIHKEYLNYRIFGYTGTLGTGVDLSTPHFDKCFAFFTGDVFAFNQQIQLLKRYRPDLEIEIYCDPKKRTLPIDADQIILNLIGTHQDAEKYFAENVGRLIEEGLILRDDGTFQDSEKDYLKLYGEINARKNASRANPLQTLKDELKNLGYEIEEITEDTKEDNKGTLDYHKKIKSDLRDAEDNAIATAQLLSDEEYEEIRKQKGSLTKQKQRQLQKTYLHKTLGVEINTTLVHLERTKKLSKGLRLLYVLLTDQETAIAFELRDRKNNPIIHDRTYWMKARNTLQQLKIPDFLAYLNDGNSYSSEDDFTKFIAETARTLHKAMDKYLGIKIRFDKDEKNKFKQSDTEIVGLILNRLGILVNSNKSSDKNRTRIYELDQSHFKMIFDTVLPHMDTEKPQQADYFVADDELLSTELFARKFFNAFKGYVKPETLYRQALNMGTPYLSFVYLSQRGCPVLSSLFSIDGAQNIEV